MPIEKLCSPRGNTEEVKKKLWVTVRRTCVEQIYLAARMARKGNDRESMQPYGDERKKLVTY